MTTQPTSTLLKLVRTVNSYTANDQEVVATVTYLVNSGKVRLGGIFAGAHIDPSGTDTTEYHLPPNGTGQAVARPKRRPPGPKTRPPYQLWG